MLCFPFGVAWFSPAAPTPRYAAAGLSCQKSCNSCTFKQMFAAFFPHFSRSLEFLPALHALQHSMHGLDCFVKGQCTRTTFALARTATVSLQYIEPVEGVGNGTCRYMSVRDLVME